MQEINQECVKVFLEKQLQLFPEKVCENETEAREFLEDCMAVVCKGRAEVLDYLEESMDTSEIRQGDFSDTPEIFPLSNDRYLIVEG